MTLGWADYLDSQISNNSSEKILDTTENLLKCLKDFSTTETHDHDQTLFESLVSLKEKIELVTIKND